MMKRYAPYFTKPLLRKKSRFNLKVSPRSDKKINNSHGNFSQSNYRMMCFDWLGQHVADRQPTEGTRYGPYSLLERRST